MLCIQVILSQKKGHNTNETISSLLKYAKTEMLKAKPIIIYILDAKIFYLDISFLKITSRCLLLRDTIVSNTLRSLVTMTIMQYNTIYSQYNDSFLVQFLVSYTFFHAFVFCFTYFLLS